MKTAVGFANFCGRAFLVLCLFVVVVRPAFAFDDPTNTCGPTELRGGRCFLPAGRRD